MLIKTFLLLFSLITFAGAPALAEDKEPEKTLLETDKYLKMLCDETLSHVPEPTVEHKPGVDINGKPVVPPDLEKEPMRQVYYPMEIPIEVDLIKKFDLNAPVGIVLNPEVSGIRIFEDGRVEYNGENVTGKVQGFCQKEVENFKAAHPEPPPGEEISGEHH